MRPVSRTRSAMLYDEPFHFCWLISRVDIQIDSWKLWCHVQKKRDVWVPPVSCQGAVVLLLASCKSSLLVWGLVILWPTSARNGPQCASCFSVLCTAVDTDLVPAASAPCYCKGRTWTLFVWAVTPGKRSYLCCGSSYDLFLKIQ